MILKIHIVPRSSTNKIMGFTKEDILKIKIKSPPVKGTANKGLIKFLSKKFNILQSNIIIKKGKKLRNKTLELIGVDKIVIDKS